jgi:hypothetical protein
MARERRMPQAEFEGRAVAMAILHMRGLDGQAARDEVLRLYGPKHLARIKRRMWQHIEANRPPAGEREEER